MARVWALAAIVIAIEVVASSEPNRSVALSSLRDSKHRSELVDEAFSEQKDVLLEMLEAKLKDVKDKKKKKKIVEKEAKLSPEQKLCETLSKDKSLVMKANGISNVGIVNLMMNHGVSGKGVLNLDADGISNVGRAHLELGMEGGVNVPGIGNSLFAAPLRLNSILCDNVDAKEKIEETKYTKNGLIKPITPKFPKIDLNSISIDIPSYPKGNIYSLDESKEFLHNETSLRKTDVKNAMSNTNISKSDNIALIAAVNATTIVNNSTNSTETNAHSTVTSAKNTDSGANATYTGTNAADNGDNATETSAFAKDTAANVSAGSAIEVKTTTVDTNDIDLSNITKLTGDVSTTVASTVVSGVPGSTVTIMSNLNTVTK